jgi:hypothetical protein
MDRGLVGEAKWLVVRAARVEPRPPFLVRQFCGVKGEYEMRQKLN